MTTLTSNSTHDFILCIASCKLPDREAKLPKILMPFCHGGVAARRGSVTHGEPKSGSGEEGRMGGQISRRKERAERQEPQTRGWEKTG